MVIGRRATLLCPNCGQTLPFTTTVEYQGDSPLPIRTSVSYVCEVCNCAMFEADNMLLRALRELTTNGIHTTSHCAMLHITADGVYVPDKQTRAWFLSKGLPVPSGRDNDWVDGPYICMTGLTFNMGASLRETMKNYIRKHSEEMRDVVLDYHVMFVPDTWSGHAPLVDIDPMYTISVNAPILRSEYYADVLIKANGHLTAFMSEWLKDMKTYNIVIPGVMPSAPANNIAMDNWMLNYAPGVSE